MVSDPELSSSDLLNSKRLSSAVDRKKAKRRAP
jgi:hypothetical protein